MKRFFVGLLACCLFILSGCGGNADKVVGTWNVVKSDGKEAPGGMGPTYEFTSDGKCKLTVGKLAFPEGTYKVEGDKIVMTGKGTDGKEQTQSMDIKSISGDTMVVSMDGKEAQLKKK